MQRVNCQAEEAVGFGRDRVGEPSGMPTRSREAPSRLKWH